MEETGQGRKSSVLLAGKKKSPSHHSLKSYLLEEKQECLNSKPCSRRGKEKRKTEPGRVAEACSLSTGKADIGET